MGDSSYSVDLGIWCAARAHAFPARESGCCHAKMLRPQDRFFCPHLGNSSGSAAAWMICHILAMPPSRILTAGQGWIYKSFTLAPCLPSCPCMIGADILTILLPYCRGCCGRGWPGQVIFSRSPRTWWTKKKNASRKNSSFTLCMQQLACPPTLHAAN